MSGKSPEIPFAIEIDPEVERRVSLLKQAHAEFGWCWDSVLELLMVIGHQPFQLVPGAIATARAHNFEIGGWSFKLVWTFANNTVRIAKARIVQAAD